MKEVSSEASLHSGGDQNQRKCDDCAATKEASWANLVEGEVKVDEPAVPAARGGRWAGTRRDPQLTLTELPPMYTSCLLITAAPHMTQSKSLIQSWADFLCCCRGEKGLFCPPQGEGQHGLQSRPASHSRWIQLWLSERERETEREGGERSSFPSDSVTRTHELQPMVANKQSLRSANGGGALGSCEGNVRAHWAHMWSPDSDERWVSWRFARNDQHHWDVWQRSEMHLAFGCGGQFTHWRKLIHPGNFKVHQLFDCFSFVDPHSCFSKMLTNKSYYLLFAKQEWENSATIGWDLNPIQVQNTTFTSTIQIIVCFVDGQTCQQCTLSTLWMDLSFITMSIIK